MSTHLIGGIVTITRQHLAW